MVILKAIGGLFTRLWRWIKETAWVQPLLIVGGIFAVIFSIPRITEWVQSMGIGSASAYYSSYKVKLEGELKGATIDSDADKLTEALWENSNLNNSPTAVSNDWASYQGVLSASGVTATYGEKFFLVYVSDDCSTCDTIQPAFKALQDDWNYRFTPSDGGTFKMYTIFTDDTSTNDDDYDLESEQHAFVRYLDKFNENGYWSEIGGRLTDEAPYKENMSIGDSDYTYLADGDHDGFATPTILLVDFSKEAFEAGRPGVSEVLFGVSGSDKFEKASLLLKMWNHCDDDNANPFSASYSR
ncbi:MAG: hypothetical protein K6F32_05955 [Bacilli bacterium]|nr:hypothetical protein [Bacilli bacterium]